MPKGHIVAMGGGALVVDGDGSPLDDVVLELTGRDEPRVCFIGTATGDADAVALRFFRTFARRRCRAIDLPLFDRGTRSPAEVIAEQDVVWVGGGNTVNMLAVWRAHGVDVALRDAWERGAVLCGSSAGAICWFESGVTDSFGRAVLQPMAGGLGFVGGSFCPHFDSEVLRRPTYTRLVAEGALPAGFACDDGAALHFHGTDLVEALSARPGAAAYRVEPTADGATIVPLAMRSLGAQGVR
jgi:peptidase E